MESPKPFEPIGDLKLLSRGRESLYSGGYIPGEIGDSSIECIALPGGGLTGATLTGVIKEFEIRGMRSGIQYWSGSSAGAICSAMGAMGASADFMIDKMINTDKKIFLDFGGQPQLESSMVKTLLKYRVGIKELINKFGLARGTKFQEWYENAMYETGWSPDTTFQDLYDRTGKHLCITGTSLNTHETLYFSRSSYPYMKISDAVHVSMCLPVIFQPIKMFDPIIPQGERYLNDGGILDNFPLNCCDVISPSGEILGFNRKAVGFNLVSNGKRVPDYVEIPGLTKYALTFISSLRNRISVTQSQQPYFWSRTVPIETYGVDSIDFNVGSDAMERLVQSGQESTKLYLDRREAMIQKYGPLPRNLFIPNDRLKYQGIEYLSDDLIEHTQIYQTNPEKFSMNAIPATENYHLWS